MATLYIFWIVCLLCLKILMSIGSVEIDVSMDKINIATPNDKKISNDLSHLPDTSDLTDLCNNNNNKNNNNNDIECGNENGAPSEKNQNQNENQNQNQNVSEKMENSQASSTTRVVIDQPSSTNTNTNRDTNTDDNTNDNTKDHTNTHASSDGDLEIAEAEEVLDLDLLMKIDLLARVEDKEFVNEKHNELVNNGILYFDDFVSSEGLNFLNKVYSLSSKYEQTIYNKITIYPFDCPFDQRNQSVSWVEQSTKSSFLWSHKLPGSYSNYFEEMYSYPSFRTFISSIVLNSYDKSGELNFVYDKDSHFYFHVQRGSPYNEYTAWHYDEHHFTCAILVSDAQYGGQFNYIQYRNITSKQDSDNGNESHSANKNSRVTRYDNFWNDEKVENMLHASKDSGISKEMFESRIAPNSHIYSVSPKQGDMYCFFGNESLHSVTQISGEGTRISLIMSMAFGDEFIHTGGAVMSLHSNSSYIEPQL